MVTATGINFAPPTQLRVDATLPLGSRVRWTHLAAVARWYDKGEADMHEWVITEPRAHGFRPRMASEPVLRGGTDIPIEFGDGDAWEAEQRWYRTRRGGRDGVEVYYDRNKTVLVWPYEGDGYLFGLVRRGIGASSKAHSYYDSYNGEHDYDPGGFAAECYVPLYAVKRQLSGLGYLFAPHWAVSVVVE